jgi:glycosyltransferase involved in cell wall biosynthesis
VKPVNIYICANGIPFLTTANQVSESKKENVVCKFLYLSNMMRGKGALVLLEACKFLKQKNLLFECHFVGAWADVTEAIFNEEVEKLNITENVFVHGKKYNEEKFNFLYQSDIFIFPTYYHNECFPLVLLEAMQFGLPVISTPEGGIPDIVTEGETGLLVPQKDARALAEKIEILIRNPELRLKMGQAGRKRFEDLFTLEKFENNMVDILDRALKQQ